MKAISKGIVKIRWLLMAIFLVVVAVSAWGMTKVKTNYDIIKYLPADSETVVALNEMENQFGAVGTAQVMVKNLDAAKVAELKVKLEGLEGMQAVVASSTDETTYKDGNALFKLFLTDSSFSPDSHKTIEQVREVLGGYDIAMNGGAVTSTFLQAGVQSDMVVILLVACAVIALILLLTSTSWVDPLVFGFVVVVSLIINLGSNAILKEVSFITKAICAIMQLALAMDYSIILLHRFNEEKKKNLNDKDAMAEAIRGSFGAVASSSLTTIAGLVALMFMKFTIGIDVGVVLTKGIVISLLSVFFFMPGVILLFAPAIKKTAHRTLQEAVGDRFRKASEKRQIKYDQQAQSDPTKKPKKAMSYIDFAFQARKVIPLLLVLFIVGGTVMNFMVKYTYQLETSKDPMAAVNAENQAIIDIFGKQNSVVVLVPTGDIKKEREVVDFMLAYKYQGKNVVNGAQGMAAMGFDTAIKKSKIEAILSEEDVRELFQKCGIAETADEILLFDIIRMAANDNNKSYLNDLLARALGIGVNLLDLAGNSYTPQTLASALNLAIHPLLPRLNVTEETMRKVFDNSGFKDETEPVLMTALLAGMSKHKIAETMITGSATISSLLQKVIDLLAPLAPQLHNQLTPAKIASLLPIDGISAKLQTLISSCKTKETSSTASVYELVQMFASTYSNTTTAKVAGSIARDTVLKLVIDKLNFAFTMFESQGYENVAGMSRLMFNLDMNTADDDSFAAMKEITEGIKKLYGEQKIYIACETAAYSSIRDSFQSDSITISLISFFAIFLIVMLTFMSVGVPFILTLLIQGATFMGMAIQFIAGAPVFFVCYLVVTCIQMGATVDYAILLTSRYIENRYTMGRKDAMKKAFGLSLMTVLTSGTILVLAAFIVGMVSNVAIIADLGVMLSIGCAISLSCILFALPEVLMLCDKFIEKTTLKKKGQRFFKEELEQDINNIAEGGALVSDTAANCDNPVVTEMEGLNNIGAEEASPKEELCGLEPVEKE